MPNLLNMAKQAADRLVKSTPAPESLETSIYADDESTGNEVIDMVDRAREEARYIHGHIEAEALDAIQTYFGNQWSHQKMGQDALDSQLGSVVFQTVVANTDSNNEMIRPVINRTQNAELSNTEARTSRPIQVRIEPEETDDEGEYWLTKEGAETLMELRQDKILQAKQVGMEQAKAMASGVQIDPQQAVDPDALVKEAEAMYPDVSATYDEKYGPTEPLTKRQAVKVQNLIDQGLMLREDLQHINDVAVAKALQKVINRMNADANLDGKYLKAALNSTNGGYSFMRFTYVTRGAKKHTISLENLPIRAAWIDPFHDDIMDSDYAGEDRAVSLERAKVMYPDLDPEKLEEAAKNSATVGEETGEAHDRRQRDMLQITTAWFRNHTVPMSEEEAVLDGLVRKEGEGEEAKYVLTEEGAEVTGGSEGEAVEPQEDKNHGTNWPDGEGIRQVVTINGLPEPVQDIRCPYWDIPMVLFINVPRVDGSPLGQGDAVRLDDVQTQINRVAAIIINNQEHAQFPMMFLPQTFKDMVESDGLDLFFHPGAVQGIPDHMLYAILQATGGFSNLIMQPPQLSPSTMELFNKLLEEHDNLSGNVGVRQGRAPYAGASGAAIGALQEQAVGTLALKARVDEHALTRYARLQQHAITTFYPESRWMQVVSKYTLPVMRRIIERASVGQFNIKVSIAAGRGVTKQLDRAQTIEMRNSGLLSLIDTLTEMEVDDPEGKAERIMREQGLSAPAGGDLSAPTPDQVAPGPGM